jgi:hypothetical protein
MRSPHQLQKHSRPSRFAYSFDGVSYLRECIKWYGGYLQPWDQWRSDEDNRNTDLRPTWLQRPICEVTAGIAIWGMDYLDKEQLSIIDSAIKNFVLPKP